MHKAHDIEETGQTAEIILFVGELGNIILVSKPHVVQHAQKSPRLRALLDLLQAAQRRNTGEIRDTILNSRMSIVFGNLAMSARLFFLVSLRKYRLAQFLLYGCPNHACGAGLVVQ